MTRPAEPVGRDGGSRATQDIASVRLQWKSEVGGSIAPPMSPERPISPARRRLARYQPDCQSRRLLYRSHKNL